MIRKHLHAALLLAAASLAVSGAYAQNTNASPQGKANAADKAEKADKDKAKDKDDKATKAADAKDAKGKDGKDGKDAVDPAKKAEERAARKTSEHDAQRAKLRGMLKSAPTEALKQELRRHAERVARIERIKAVAQVEKDNDTVQKADKLIAKENERHDKWMSKHAAEQGATPTVGTPTTATPTTATPTTGGAK